MKKITFIIVLASIMLSNCSSDNNDDYLLEQPLTLAQNEIDDLSFLREEEKLA